MTRYKHRFVAIFFTAILCWINEGSLASAQPVVPIYQINETAGTFIQVSLNHDIYRYSTRPDLSDLQVLDSDQNPLPFRLINTASGEKAEPEINATSLAFYPVAADATAETLRKLHTEQLSLHGNQVHISSSDRVINNQTPEFYLIDISNLENDIDGLRIDWHSQENNQYLQLELEASHNLQDWQSLGNATLVQINQQEQILKRNYVAARIHKKDYEFLRIKVLRGAENLQITAINAEQKVAVSVARAQSDEHWLLEGKTLGKNDTVNLPNTHSKVYPVVAWEFTRDEATPADTVSIELGENPYGDAARIFSRNDDNKSWTLRYQGIWFNAQVGELWQKSDAINLYRNTDKYWRLELNENTKNNIDAKLVFSWQPMEVQIITNNKSPYFIAINTQKHDASVDSHTQIFNHLVSNSTPAWVSATPEPLNISPETIRAFSTVGKWKQWVFWGALLLAVLVLVIFSLKLLKQLKTAADS